jgi:apolipoprotein N-acyltransferase
LNSWLKGPRGSALLFLAGLLSGLAMPPLGLWPVLFVTIPFVIMRFETVTTFWGGFRCGWIFGFGYFVMCLHWIGFAFLIDAATYLWMMPFAVGGLAAIMAIYWAIAAGASVVLRRSFGLPLFLVFPATLTVCEWLRGHLLTGFPWAVPGLVAERMGGVAQSVSVVGMTGMTLIVLLWAAAPAAYLRYRNRMGAVTAVAIVATLPVIWLLGLQRVAVHPPQYVDGVALRIVQPNISQDDKWRADNASRIFDDLLAFSGAPARDGRVPSHIIWPESAVPFLLDESDGGRTALAQTLGAGQMLITGAIRRARPDPSADYFTSILVFDDTAHLVSTYDKWRLVPGGEFLPFAWLLEPIGFQRLVSLPGSFAAGTGPKSLEIPGAGRAGPIICYEVIFPDRLIATEPRPNWILNVTNDGWFGNSVGPYQHLAQARLRAIEQGLPLVRSANTGISAVFDGVGRAIAMAPLSVPSVIDSSLPQALPATLYARSGDALMWALVVITFLVSFGFARKLR